jgi:hypothetical protein
VVWRSQRVPFHLPGCPRSHSAPCRSRGTPLRAPRHRPRPFETRRFVCRIDLRTAALPGYTGLSLLRLASAFSAVSHRSIWASVRYSVAVAEGFHLPRKALPNYLPALT